MKHLRTALSALVLLISLPLLTLTMTLNALSRAVLELALWINPHHSPEND